MTPAKILIVEDEQITAADLEDTLVELGHEVAGSAATATDAIKLADKLRPDLALMDIRLKGDVDGIEAAVILRERYEIPSIFLTAHADDATLDRAKAAEPLGYLVKPFQASELQASIQMALYRGVRERSLRDHEGELSTTLEALSEGVIRVDGLGEVIYLNPAAERWTGWTRKETEGAHISEVFQLVDHRSGRSLERFVREAIAASDITELAPGSAVRSRIGMEQLAHGSIAPLRDALDRPAGAVIAFCHASSMEEQDNADQDVPCTLDDSIIAASEPMVRLLRYARRIAVSEVTTVLLEGESGVGKDVIAQFLHRRSRRRAKPFVAVNCAAIPDTLLESELFGYEKGAFTDARSQKRGVLEMAAGGTVFLDEIGEVQPHIQAKLLRVLEHQSFRRLGGLRDVVIDVRIVAATNRDLVQAVRDREFREDLFYRLNVIQIAIPPLRDRPEDILPLAEHFIRHYNQRFHRRVEGLRPAAVDRLTGHGWPGNVRELRNVIERAMVLEESDWIEPETLEIDRNGIERPSALAAAVGHTSLEEAERSMLAEALEKCGGNQTQAAKMLGISRDTLRYRIKKFDLRVL